MRLTTCLLLAVLFPAIRPFSLSPFACGAGEALDPDEQVLHEAHIGTDEASLLGYLQKHTGTDDDLAHLDQLIRQLSSSVFTQREQASKRIVSLGPVALPALRVAKTGPDAEVSRRAQECIAAINEDSKSESLVAVIRLLVKHPSEAGLKGLLRFLPYALDEELQEEVWFGMDAVLATDARLRVALATALSERVPVRRAAAACILGHRGTDEQRSDVGKLLVDGDALVRLRAAQGLLAARSNKGVPTLIGLLDQPLIDLAWQAEELLSWIAADDSPVAVVGAGAPPDRKRCRQAWQSWWDQKGAKLDLTGLDVSYRRPQLMLVCGTSMKNEGHIYLLGCNGRQRWRIQGIQTPWCARFLGGSRILVSEWESARLSERNLEGKVLWEQNLAEWRGDPQIRGPGYCQRLPNGNTFAVLRDGAIEIDPDGKVVFAHMDYRDVYRDKLWPIPAQMLRNGRVLCYCGAPRGGLSDLVECEPATGKVAKRVPLHGTNFTGWNPCSAQILPNGHYLLVEQTPLGRLAEVDAAGRTIWRYTLKRSGASANHLRNGNTLVAYSGVVIDEIDAGDRVVWEAIVPDAVKYLEPCLSLCSLGFDIPASQQRDFSQDVSYQINRLKNPDAIIRYQAMRLLSDLGPRAEPAIPALMQMFRDPDDGLSGAATTALHAIGAKAVPELVKLAKDGQAHIRARAVLALASLQFANSLPVVFEALRDKEPFVRRAAVNGLQGLIWRDKKVAGTLQLSDAEFEQIVSELIKGLSDPDNTDDPQELTVPRHSIRVLALLGPKSNAAVPEVLKLLRSRDVYLRGYAIVALGAIGANREVAIPALLEVLRCEDITDVSKKEHLRNCVAAALSDIAGPEAEPAIPALLEVLKDQNTHRAYRLSAMKALGKIGHKASIAVPALTAFLRNKDQKLRTEAENALRNIRE